MKTGHENRFMNIEVKTVVNFYNWNGKRYHYMHDFKDFFRQTE